MSCKYMDNSCREEKMGCEGCAYYEKSADEMFEELGYKKFYENTDTTRYSNNISIIEFRNGMKAFDKSPYGISIQELQAINKKVEELKWK